MVEVASIVGFVVALVVATIVIYVVTKLLGEKAVIGGIFWLLALKALYKIGWLKALAIAIIVWILATIIGFFLPTLPGPL